MIVSTCSNRQILVPCGLQNFEYQVDTYIGCEHYCKYCYVLNQAETDWSKEVLIHSDIVTQLEDELKEIPPQKVYMGYYSDPYQPIEAERHQTRKALELFLSKGFSASILTKSDLVARDMDLLQTMDGASVSVSVAFNDNLIRQQFEANTIDTEARIKALHILRTAGIGTSALICPVIPYITDVPRLVEMLAPHTDTIWIYGLSFQERSGKNWKNVKSILAKHFPSLQKEVELVVFSKEHAYWKQLKQNLMELQKVNRVKLNIHL